MNPHTAKARKELIATLKEHQAITRGEIESNTWKINRLTETQAIQKRKMVEITNLIHELTKQEK